MIEIYNLFCCTFLYYQVIRGTTRESRNSSLNFRIFLILQRCTIINIETLKYHHNFYV